MTPSFSLLLQASSDLQTRKHYAMGVTSLGGKLELLEFTPPTLGEEEVFVKVSYCGMCHR